MGDAGVAGEERVGAEQDRGVRAVNELRHDAVVQRRRIEIDRHAGDSGSIKPTVRPKEWNTGSTLNTLSSRPKSMRAAACAALASMLRCDSTTPFGAPSEPEVNRIAAGSSALRATSGRAGTQQAAQLVGEGDAWRGCPRDRRSRTFSRARRRGCSSFAFSTKRARRQDRRRLRRLAGGENVRRAGGEVDHRRHPADRHQPRGTSRPRLGVRQHHADRVARAADRASLPPSTCAPIRSLR